MFRALFAIFIFLFLTPTFAVELVEIKNVGKLKRAYFIFDDEVNDVRVDLIIHTGSVDLNGPEGMAHYLEHLVFFNADEVYENASYKKRHANASTSNLYTNYINIGAPKQLKKMLANMAKVFEPIELDEEYANSEIDIIEREYNLTMNDDPIAKISERLLKLLYGKTGFGRSVIGSIDDIAKFTPKLAFDIHKKYYVPANASLFITGNIKLKKVEKLVAKYFKNLKGGDFDIKAISDFSPISTRQIKAIIEPQLDRERLIYLNDFVLPDNMSFDEIDVAFGLLKSILNSPLDGSLAKPLSFDKFMISKYSLSLEQLGNGRAMLTFIASPDDGVKVKEILDLFEETLLDIAKNKIPIKTFNRRKEKMLTSITKKVKKPDYDYAINKAMDRLLQDKNPISAQDYLSLYKKISLDDLNLLLEKITTSNNIAIALIYPENSND